VFDIGADPDEIGLFDGNFLAYSTSQFVLTKGRSSRIRLERSPETIARSRLDHFAIRVLVSGSAAGLAGHQAIDAKVGDVFFIDLAQTLNLQLSVQGELTADITLWIPRARLLASVSDENALHGLVLRGTSPPGALIGGSLRSLAEHAEQMTTDELNALANGVIELTAKAIAPALEQAGASAVPAPLASFVTIRRYIDRNLTSPALDADSIAKNFGLSRASLYRLFEPVGGIASYIRKARLNRAYQEIITLEFSDRRIGQIAYSLGFKNVSAFNRLFHSIYGFSPSEARERATKGFSGTTLKARAATETSLAGLLARIAGP
jgi:AraC-like DNA-binding protein